MILGFFMDTGMPTAFVSAESTLHRIQAVLRRMDALPMPRSLRPLVETTLVRQVARMMDAALPFQRGHGRRTARLARSIGARAQLSVASLHQLTLAALLHDVPAPPSV